MVMLAQGMTAGANPPAGAAGASQPQARQRNTLDLSRAMAGQGATVEFNVTLNNSVMAVQDFQFDVIFDPAVLEYVDGSYARGTAIKDWKLADDNLIAPGHLRFAALDPTQAIPIGSGHLLVTLKFTVRCNGCTDGKRSPLRLTQLDGGINGIEPRDGLFTFEGAE
jgi:hypothetical protein